MRTRGFSILLLRFLLAVTGPGQQTHAADKMYLTEMGAAKIERADI